MVALKATVTLTYIPVMTPGLYDMFPGPPGTFPGHIRWFPVKYQYFDQKRPRKPSNMPRKCLRKSRKCVIESMSHQWVSHGIEVNVTVALRATRYASFIEIRIILQFHQFRFPGFSGNFNPFLHTFPGSPGR